MKKDGSSDVRVSFAFWSLRCCNWNATKPKGNPFKNKQEIK
jgi:hypothetical protein